MVRVSAHDQAVAPWQPEALRKTAQVTSDAVTDLRAVDGSLEPVKPPGAPSVTRLEFRDFLLAERNRARNCGTLPLTVVLWITFLFVTWNHGNITSIHRIRRCLHKTVEEIRVAQPLPDGSFGPANTLTNISSTEEAWTWISQGLLHALRGPESRRGYVCTFNQVVGKLQLRQTRQSAGACRVEGPLAEYYRGDCRSGADSADAFAFGVEDERLGPGLQDPAFLAGGGMRGLSEVNGEKFFGWLDPRRPEAAATRARQLAERGWCDQSTKLLEVTVALFNAEVQAFTLISIDFTFESGGLVTNNVEVYPLSTRIYPTAWYVIVDVAWLLLITAFFFLVLQEAFDRRGHGCCGRCCGSLWMVIDWISIVTGLGVIGFFAFFLQHLTELERKVASLGSDTPLAVASTMSNSTEALLYDGKLTNVIEDLDWLIYFKGNHRLGMFWYVMLLLCRFFRGFTGQPRIHLIGSTLEKASSDIMHFGILLLAICENFALGGCVLFGADLAEWASVSLAHRSTLAVLFGQGDFAAMYDVAPVRATIWLVMFLVSVVFLVTNMVVAILCNHYREAKQVTGLATSSIFEQFRIHVDEFIWKTAYHYRTVHRFVYKRLNASMQKCLHKFEDEPRRTPFVPYDLLLEATTEGMADAVEKEMVNTDVRYVDPTQPFPWSPMSKDLILRCGVDIATAEYLLRKCAACINGRLPDVFPADQLFFEFQNGMHGSYRQLDSVGEELHAWLADRNVDVGNIYPRQKKLEDLSQHIEISSGAMEGIPEMPALGYDGDGGFGKPLETEDLMQVGDRLLELGADAATNSAQSGALVPLPRAPP